MELYGVWVSPRPMTLSAPWFVYLKPGPVGGPLPMEIGNLGANRETTNRKDTTPMEMNIPNLKNRLRRLLRSRRAARAWDGVNLSFRRLVFVAMIPRYRKSLTLAAVI